MIKLINVGEYTLKKLTLKEKASLLTGGGYWSSMPLKNAGVPEIRFADGPSGLRPQGDKGDNLGESKSFPATCFPSHSALACSWNRSLIYGVGKRIGEEAASYGVDVVLAPALNVKRDALCGRNFEYFSEEPYLNGKLGAEFVNGLKSAGAEACLKHFAANNREFARMVCDSAVDERTLREIYLTAFEIAVKESKPAAVMTAYNRLNGVYCNQNEKLLRGILRGEWGFEGIVVSDWGGTYSRVDAVRAGADLEMPPCRFSADEIIGAVERGELEEKYIDECAERIIALAKREKPKRTLSDTEEHSRFSRTCAEQCAVLLKNDGALPLKENERFALIGEAALQPLIQGGGSSKVEPENTDSLYEILKVKATGFERGYKKKGKSKKLFSRALKLCKRADSVIFCAALYSGDTEGADREDARLPQEQLQLLNEIYKLGKKVTVVVFCGCAIETDWDERASAVLYAGLSGQSCAGAVADVLTGKVNPSGKLTESFPYTADASERLPYGEVYSEAMGVGYRAEKEYKYPFGYGLSYTRFGYSDLSVSETGVSFTVTNTGECAGGEAVQLYVRYPENANAPKLQLKGFDKVFLAAGESKRVSIDFDEYTFRSFDTSSGEWALAEGEYVIFIGASSADLRLSAKVMRSGVKYIPPCDTSRLQARGYEIKKDKKGRVACDLHTPLCEIKNARGLFGRLFAKSILRFVRNRKTVYGSMQYLPLRTLAQYGKMKKSTVEKLIYAFNGFKRKHSKK